jgi:outer membrane protein TolC
MRILDQQKTLDEYNVSRYKLARLPSLSGFYNYQQSNFGETYDLSNWYSNSVYGFNVSIPLFTGFSNNAKVQKAKIDLYKTENNMANARNLIRVDFYRSKSNFLRAMESLSIQDENLQLAKDIFKVTTIKYQQGVGSNLEVTTAQQDLKTAQTNYLNSLYDLIVAKIELQMASGNNLTF